MSASFNEDTALESNEQMRAFNVIATNQFSSRRSPSQVELPALGDANSVERTIEICTSRLSTHYQKYKEVLGFKRPYLKMDTQGNDLFVADGAVEFLHEFVGVQSELSIRRLYDGSADFSTALKYFISRGFELSAFVPNNAAHFPALLEIDCILYCSALQS